MTVSPLPARFSGWLLLLAVAAASACFASESRNLHFLGPEPCALCHRDIAAAQDQTAMANTWQGRLSSWLPPSFAASITEDLPYRIKRSADSITYSVGLAATNNVSFPLTVVVGGRRHGLGFLFSIEDVAGIPLARPTLIQARYAWSPEKQKLLLAPGCVATKPHSFESALGLVLSPTFEARCISCHGQPGLAGSGTAGGVHCETCHGPGSAHLAALARKDPNPGIVNPMRLPVEASIAICARCHVGLTNFSDPSPDDLLIANQVRAIKSSECFLQSRSAFSCTTCHSPHSDAADDRRAVSACLGCHSSRVSAHAAICSVNATTGCIGCHMPSVNKGPLHLVDHLIRVHPEQGEWQAAKAHAELATRVEPVSEYLRIIATKTPEASAAALGLLDAGKSFYAVAREISVDRSSAIGGYLGRKTLTELESNLKDGAATLAYGQTSPVLHSGDRWIVLQRLPRDFRWEAERLQDQAETLAATGDPVAAIEKSQEALKIYPQFLRALCFIGATYTRSGNPAEGARVLTTATRLYPTDAGAEFALAASLNLLGDRPGAIEAYKRVIAREVDFTAAYVDLGVIYNSSRDWPGAIRILRQGLQINPLSAELNYQFALALLASGDTKAGNQAITLARKLGLDLAMIK